MKPWQFNLFALLLWSACIGLLYIVCDWLTLKGVLPWPEWAAGLLLVFGILAAGGFHIAWQEAEAKRAKEKRRIDEVKECERAILNRELADLRRQNAVLKDILRQEVERISEELNG